MAIEVLSSGQPHQTEQHGQLGQAGQPGMQAGPETLFCDFVAAGNFQFVKALKEFHDGLQAPIAYVATSQYETVNACCAVWKVLEANKQTNMID